LFNNKPICTVDSGINTAATCSIVTADGTVIARTFLKCGRHNDQRDKLMAQIREKAAQTSLQDTPVKKGFCSSLYRRIAGINKQAAREIGRQIVDFAMKHDAATVVFEHLKSWRPKAPKKSMRHRFHRFLHRAIVKCVEHKAKEQGMRMAFVPPRGTSAWAYDGSGLVKRDAKNYSLCEFTTGKQYNADLNAANNIAARFIMRALSDVGLVPNDRPAAGECGKSSNPAPGMPVCLSDVWAFAASLKQGGAQAPLCLS
jgi:IS605 OrfB family transposase